MIVKYRLIKKETEHLATTAFYETARALAHSSRWNTDRPAFPSFLEIIQKQVAVKSPAYLTKELPLKGTYKPLAGSLYQLTILFGGKKIKYKPEQIDVYAVKFGREKTRLFTLDGEVFEMNTSWIQSMRKRVIMREEELLVKWLKLEEIFDATGFSELRPPEEFNMNAFVYTSENLPLKGEYPPKYGYMHDITYLNRKREKVTYTAYSLRFSGDGSFDCINHKFDKLTLSTDNIVSLRERKARMREIINIRTVDPDRLVVPAK